MNDEYIMKEKNKRRNKNRCPLIPQIFYFKGKEHEIW